MKMLITGGAGFIGANFVHYIVEKYPDYEITVVDKLTYAGDKDRLKTVLDKIEFVQGDICDIEAMSALIEGKDTVVHFAAESHVDRSIADPTPFLQSNIIGTGVIARLAVDHNIKRFHHISTDEVFGTLDLHSETMFNEETPYDPRSPYSASKASSDHVVRAFGETYGLPYTITNCSNNYGPYDSPGRIIPLFIANALEDKPLTIYGKGEFVRDYLFVTDHCSAIDAVIHKGEVQTTYCVGGGAQRNGLEVAEAILAATGKPESLITYVTDRPGHDPRYAIDNSKIRAELGWEPSVDFEEGIRRTMEWYKENNDWVQGYKERMTLMRDTDVYDKATEK